MQITLQVVPVLLDGFLLAIVSTAEDKIGGKC